MKHKVWRSEEEILAAIDRALGAVQECWTRCEALQMQIADCRGELSRAKKAGRIEQLKSELEDLWKDHDRIAKRARALEDTTLPRLKRTLAAFRTRTFDFMGDYQGVVAA